MRLIIAGGRDFNDYEMLSYAISYNLAGHTLSNVTILDGCATGADRLGRKYSEEVLNKPTERYPAKWDDISVEGTIVKYRDGKPYNAAAGFQRNQQMADNATHLIAFWDGKSHGTRDMIKRANKAELTVVVVRY